MKDIHIKKLQLIHANECTRLIQFNKKDEISLKALGWKKTQIISQFQKKINLSFGIFYKNKLIAFIIGDLIYVEKVSEYEILLIYVKTTYRKKGLANNLLNNLYSHKNKLKLKKIFLEVAENNKPAIKMYKKNKFKLINIRKNYYKINKKNFDAFSYSKVI